MSGGITGEEAPAKITYEQYKKGIRDAKKNYEKLFKGAGRGHVSTGAN
eukprot:SAG31_NODE_735_length_12488_cov_7.086044_5_plen_48_part_00